MLALTGAVIDDSYEGVHDNKQSSCERFSEWYRRRTHMTHEQSIVFEQHDILITLLHRFSRVGGVDAMITYFHHVTCAP